MWGLFLSQVNIVNERRLEKKSRVRRRWRCGDGGGPCNNDSIHAEVDSYKAFEPTTNHHSHIIHYYSSTHISVIMVGIIIPLTSSLPCSSSHSAVEVVGAIPMIFNGGFRNSLGAVALSFRGHGGFSNLEVGCSGNNVPFKIFSPTNILHLQEDQNTINLFFLPIYPSISYLVSYFSITFPPSLWRALL